MNENQNNIESLYPEEMNFNPETMSFSKKETPKKTESTSSQQNLSNAFNNPLFAMLGANKNNPLSSLLNSGKNDSFANMLSGDKNELLMKALSGNFGQKNTAQTKSSENKPTFEEF